MPEHRTISQERLWVLGQYLFSFCSRADLPEWGHDPRFTLPHIFTANVEKLAMKIEEFGHWTVFTLQNGGDKQSKVKRLFATRLLNLRSKTNSIHNVLYILWQQYNFASQRAENVQLQIWKCPERSRMKPYIAKQSLKLLLPYHRQLLSAMCHCKKHGIKNLLLKAHGFLSWMETKHCNSELLTGWKLQVFIISILHINDTTQQ